MEQATVIGQAIGRISMGKCGEGIDDDPDNVFGRRNTCPLPPVPDTLSNRRG